MAKSTIMNEEELLASIKMKIPDFSITISDLRNPTAKFVQNYYVNLLAELDMDEEVLNNPSEEQLNQLMCPEVHLHLLPIMNLYAVVKSIFNKIYREDFSLSDLTEPNPKCSFSLMRDMDLLHNFADWKTRDAFDFIDNLKQRLLERDCLYNKSEKLKEDLNRRAREKMNLETRKSKILEDTEKMKTKLCDFHNEYGGLQENVKRLEPELTELKHLREKLQSKCQKEEEEYMKLQNQIVKSPDELFAGLKYLETKKKEVEEQGNSLKKVKQEKGRQKELYMKYLQDQKERDMKSEELIEAHKESKSLKNEIKKREMQEETFKANIQETIQKLKKLKLKHAQLIEMKTSFIFQHDGNRNDLMNMIEEVKRERNHLLLKMEEMQKRVSEIRREVSEKEEEFETLKIKGDKSLVENEELYKEMTSKYNMEIQSMKHIMQDLEKDIEEKKILLLE